MRNEHLIEKNATIRTEGWERERIENNKWVKNSTKNLSRSFNLLSHFKCICSLARTHTHTHYSKANRNDIQDDEQDDHNGKIIS